MRFSLAVVALVPLVAAQSPLFPVATRSVNDKVASQISTDIYKYVTSVINTPQYTSVVRLLANDNDIDIDDPIALADDCEWISSPAGLGAEHPFHMGFLCTARRLLLHRWGLFADSACALM